MGQFAESNHWFNLFPHQTERLCNQFQMEALTAVGSIISHIREQALQWKCVFRLSSEVWYKHSVDRTLPAITMKP